MPNLKQHLVIGSVVGVGTYFIMCRYYNRRLDVGESLVCAGLALVASAAPDVLEPATQPNHRAFGHSLALAAGLAKFASSKCNKENRDWKEFEKILSAVAVMAYLAHLVADACTAKRLPLLGA